MAKSHIVRVRVTLEFLGILPVGGNNSPPDDQAKRLFRMMDVGIAGFVLENKDFKVTSKEIELPEAP